MKLGILVNTKDHLQDIVGITNAAVAKGHSVTIFVMDEGIHLLSDPLSDPRFSELESIDGVVMSYCDHNAQQLNLEKKGLPAGVECGSQYNNSVMGHEADRIIVL